MIQVYVYVCFRALIFENINPKGPHELGGLFNA